MNRRKFLALVATGVASAQSGPSGHTSTSGIVGLGTNIAVVPPPAGLGFTPPFAVTLAGTGAYGWTFNIDAAKPAFTTTIYVGPGGNNANNGLTYPNRVRSLQQAVVLANAAGGAVRLLVDPAQYKCSNVDGSGIPDDFSGTSPACATLVIEPNGNGQIVSVHDQAMPAYSLASGSIYVSAYTTQAPNQGAWDSAHLNTKGNPQALRNVTGSLDGNPTAIYSAMNAIWTLYGQGASYLDLTSKKLYVRLSDNRAPDANLTVGRGLLGSAAARHMYMTGAYSLQQVAWFSNLAWWGGDAFFSFMYAPDAAPSLTIYLKQCSTLYSSADGFHLDGAGSCFMVGHTSDDCFKDGYNYTGSSAGSASPHFYELGCTGDWCGNDDNTNDASSNGSSSHNTCRGIRINSFYRESQNRTIHEIEGAVTWNLGCAATNCRQTGTQSASFVSGYQPDVGDTAIVYLDGCLTSGVTYNLQAYNGGTVLTRNMSTGGFANLNSGGTIGTY